MYISIMPNVNRIGNMYIIACCPIPGTYFHFIFQVCANGLVKFQSRSYEVNPRNFGTYGGSGGSACLAPYWSFVNLDYFQSGQSKVFFRKYEDSNNDFRGVFTEARGYGNTILSKSEYNPFWVTVITWVDLRPKQPGDVTYGGVSKLNYSLNSFSFAHN
jgi:hypothetical protein